MACGSKKGKSLGKGVLSGPLHPAESEAGGEAGETIDE